MGYMMAMGECYACKKMFTFNPELVPSLPVNGVREAICRECIERANPKRIENGLEPVRIQPGAYDFAEVD